MLKKCATSFGFIFGLSLLAAGCQSSSEPKKAGTYAAARQMRIGSNIPQPTSADNVNSTAMSADELDRMSRLQSTANLGGLGGGGGGR